MASKDYFLALDIGSAHIKALVGSVHRDGGLSLAGLFKMPSRGMRRGMVSDSAEVTGAVNQALMEVRKTYPTAHKRIFVNIGSAYARAQASRGIIAVARADYEIHHDDIARVEAAAQAVNMPPNRMIVHLINQEYIVDGVSGIKDPLGMVGNRLEVSTIIVDAFEPAVKALAKSIEIASGEVEGLIFGPLAASRSILTRNQKDLGVVLIDIGYGTASMSVYEEGSLAHLAVFPIGASNITNDLAIGLTVSIEAAEAIKCSFGSALVKDIPSRDMLDLKKIDPRARHVVSRRLVGEIVEARLTELFEMVNDELKKIGKAGRLPAGAVLVGGGAKLPGMVDLVRQELKLPVQIGSPDLAHIDIRQGEIALKVEDPEFACSLGLALWAAEHSAAPRQSYSVRSALKKISQYFMP